MIKCEVIEDFRLNDFKKLKNIVRKGPKLEGKLFVGDVFECDKKMAEYLTGKNALKKTVVKIIEVKTENDDDITEKNFEVRNEDTKKDIKNKVEKMDKVINIKNKKNKKNIEDLKEV